MRFMMVDLTARDVRATAAFYRLLGVDVPDGSIWEQDDMQHVEAALSSDTQLGMNSPAITRSYDPSCESGAPAVLIFQVDTREAVDGKHAELVAAGHRSHVAPLDAMWGSRYAIVEDPDGNHVGIMSPSDRAHE
jgi:uncharacterized glyoxalase superfamily protein PhnB